MDSIINWGTIGLGVAALGVASYYLGHRNGQNSKETSSSLPYKQRYIIPIDDLKEGQYTEEEKDARCKLAAFYRVVDLLGWTEQIYNHISLKVPGDDECFLINPFGLHYSEVTASNLVKIDIDGKIIDPGTTKLGILVTGYIIHSAIHGARKDVKCIAHVHTAAGTAVSVMKCGLLPISGHAICVGDISYYDYQGISCDEEEKKDIAECLGPVNKAMIMRNHGLIALGKNVEESYQILFNLMTACETQVRVIGVGLENIIQPKEEVIKKVSGEIRLSDHDFGSGEMEFECIMRQLDRMGYKSGYKYKLNHLIEQ